MLGNTCVVWTGVLSCWCKSYHGVRRVLELSLIVEKDKTLKKREMDKEDREAQAQL